MRVRSLFLVLCVVLVSACGSNPCDASLCGGCCDPSGVCQPGDTAGACGSAGLTCMQCAQGQVCRSGACAAPPACQPLTCEALGKNCGQVADGCGGELECGACGAGETCGGAGTSNVCGPGTCAPKSCADSAAECGQLSDGCGALLSCGTCSSGTCGGGGPNKCGTCAPKNCTQLGANCGLAPDGCGGMASCGACSAAGETCGGGGTANVCGKGACMPRSCAAAQRQCGQLDDGCGNMLFCGNCTGFQTCGGGGTPGACGATCLVTCPTGYSCDSQGTCTGGSASSLAFNVKTFDVGGTVTVNGAALPNICSSWTSHGAVTFVETTTGTTFSVPVPCNGTTPFSGVVYPGTYRVSVSVRPAGSQLPALQVSSALTIGANTTNLAFDVRTFDVGGAVTVNGAALPNICSSWTSHGAVTFVEATTGTTFSIPVPCNGTTPFSGMVYPGTYRVSVSVRPAGNQLPALQVSSALTIGGNTTNLAFDVRTFDVGGLVTANGAALPNICSSWTSHGAVTFVEATTGTTFSIPVPCNGTTPFSGMVYPGTYRVSVSVRPAGNQLPALQVSSALTIGGNTTNLAFDVRTFDVGGLVTANGAALPNICSSWTSHGAVTFVDTTSGTTFSVPVPCNGTTPFSGRVYPGTYRVSVSVRPAGNQLPALQVSSGLNIGANTTNLAFDVGTVDVGGAVTVNGSALPNICSSWTSHGAVTFVETTSGTTFSIPVPCNGTTPFSGKVYPGTYRVSVSVRPAGNQLPALQVSAALAVSASTTNLAFDVVTVDVSGTVTLNGAALPNICSSWTSHGSVRFVAVGTGTTFNIPVPCNGTTPFSGKVYPGTYQVAVSVRATSQLPSQVVAERLTIP